MPQLDGGELGNFCFNGDRRVAIAYFPYVANDVYPQFKRKVSCYTSSNGLTFPHGALLLEEIIIAFYLVFA